MTRKSLDFFYRQERIPWFSQDKVNSTIITLLGVGGIGTNIAMLAARLGVGKIHLVDMDIIEGSNLNRQILYSKDNIGDKKVIRAKETLDNLDNLTSEIFAHNYDIFEDWTKTIDIVKESDYILNGLDQPEIKRTLIGVLCFALKTPMIYSGTDPYSGYSGMILYQASKSQEPCHECLQAILNSLEEESLQTKYTVNNIQSFKSVDWKELEPKNFKKAPPGATTVVTAMFSSLLAMNQVIRDLHNQDCPHRIIFDLFSDSVERFFLKKRDDCLVCGDIT